MRRFKVALRECVLIKYAHDDRYSADEAATHDRITMPALSCTALQDLPESKLKDAHVIGVDEGQFFPDVVSFCEKMANRGKVVIVSALDGTFERKPFGSILNLVPLAESVIKLNSVCISCQGDASFSKRLGVEKEIEVIGGQESYIAVCRSCYLDPTVRESPKKASFKARSKIQTDEKSNVVASCEANGTSSTPRMGSSSTPRMGAKRSQSSQGTGGSIPRSEGREDGSKRSKTL
jgi:thymidine kinase